MEQRLRQEFNKRFDEQRQDTNELKQSVEGLQESNQQLVHSNQQLGKRVSALEERRSRRSSPAVSVVGEEQAPVPAAQNISDIQIEV